MGSLPYAKIPYAQDRFEVLGDTWILVGLHSQKMTTVTAEAVFHPTVREDLEILTITWEGKNDEVRVVININNQEIEIFQKKIP